MSYACTSVIVSSRATANGRPLMFKNRDTGELNNRIEYFKGKKFDFIGLVNSPSEGGEVWTGTNEAGFSIMNTASYNIKDDDVPDSQMDREGIIMYEASESAAPWKISENSSRITKNRLELKPISVSSTPKVVLRILK